MFDSGIGIDQSGERLRTPDWTPVLPVASLTNGKPQRVEVDGVGLVLCERRQRADSGVRRVLPASGCSDERWAGSIVAGWCAHGTVRGSSLLGRGTARPVGGAVAALSDPDQRRDDRVARRSPAFTAICQQEGRRASERLRPCCRITTRCSKGWAAKGHRRRGRSARSVRHYSTIMLVELDIHFRIEDDLYYPALSGGQLVDRRRAR